MKYVIHTAVSESEHQIHWVLDYAPLRFHNILRDEFGIEATLPSELTSELEVDAASHLFITPVGQEVIPSYNAKIERLAGPFYTFSNGVCSTSYTVEPLPLEGAINMQIDVCAANRYEAEVRGFDLVVQGQTVRIDTARDVRDEFFKKYTLGADAEVFKFPRGQWLTLSNAEYAAIASAIQQHLEKVFAWEHQKVLELRACKTLQELDAVVLDYTPVSV